MAISASVRSRHHVYTASTASTLVVTGGGELFVRLGLRMIRPVWGRILAAPSRSRALGMVSS